MKTQKTTISIALLTLCALAVMAPGAPGRIAWAAQEHAKTPSQETAKTVSASELEEQYGLRVMRIAVTGGGGLIDFRFKVLDPEKAKQVLDPHHTPSLRVEESGALLSTTMGMAHNIRVQKDALSLVLFPNVRNAVKAGTPVSAVFGSVRVEPIKAQ